MIKKFLALATTALLSLNANAGYVQYDLTGPVSGYVVQHDDNGAIADYDLGVTFAVGGTSHFFSYNRNSSDIATAGTLYPQGGPTQFFMISSADSISTDFFVRYEMTGNGTYQYKAHLVGGIKVGQEWQEVDSTLYGAAIKGTVAPQLAAILDRSNGYAPNVSPVTPIQYSPTQHVPEPGSLSLFGIALVGMGLYRRRKAT